MAEMTTVYKIFSILSILLGIFCIIAAAATGTASATAMTLIVLIFFGGGYYLWKLSDGEGKKGKPGNFCPRCGKENEGDAEFCNYCGSGLTRPSGIVHSPVPSATVHPDVPYSVHSGMQYVGFWTRLGAYLIDFVILLIIAVFVFMLSFAMFPNPYGYYSGVSKQATDTAYVLVLAIFFLYFTLQEAGSAQATIGKRAVKIKVVNGSGNRISYGQAAIRNFLRVIPIVGFICVIVIGFTEKKQGLHDMIASTFVVLQ